MATKSLKSPPSRFRASPARGLKKQSDDQPTIERDGGDYGAGIIRGVAVVSRGEALGHRMWLDQQFVEQTAKAITDAPNGVKARFTHPGLSSDGMGKFLGRIKNGRVDGTVARGDLHLSDTAHNTPDGDLAEYVMNLAEEDPEAFGTSIVFEHDRGEEERFAAQHRNKEGRFNSPDKDNANHYFHARLGRLLADDVVDQPASNPDGFFHRGDEIADEADRLLSYALGLSAERPSLSQLDIDPDRVSGFVERFLDQHGLSVVPVEEIPMGDPKNPGTPAPENKPADDVNLEKERLAALKAKYGSDPGFVLEMFDSGKSMSEAETEWLKRENAKQAERLAVLDEELKKFKAAQLPASKPGGAKPVAFAGGSDSSDDDAGDFMEQAQALSEQKKIPLHKAMGQLAARKPELHAAYVEWSRQQAGQPVK